MLVNGKRALAYVTTIDEISPLDGYDRVEYARVGGWGIIVSKADQFKPGDKCVYFEVDSKVNADDPRFAFMAKRDYKVKCIKMCKVYSQGLIMPVSVFDELKDANVGDDVTDILKVRYSVEEDNARKSDVVEKKLTFFERIKNFFTGKKVTNPRKFPTKFEYVKKSDEERVENMPFILKDKEPWIKTQKIDGTSSTYIMEKKPFGRWEYYVCSRNVRQLNRNQFTWHNKGGKSESNVYWDMNDKYHIDEFLKRYIKDNNLKYAALQGETAGPNLQGNPHKYGEVRFFGYNLIRSDVGRINSLDAKKICNANGIDWVPIADEHYILPDDMETLKLDADGECIVGTGLREGWVYRSLDGQRSFKNVSRKYMMKHDE